MLENTGEERVTLWRANVEAIGEHIDDLLREAAGASRESATVNLWNADSIRLFGAAMRDAVPAAVFHVVRDGGGTRHARFDADIVGMGEGELVLRLDAPWPDSSAGGICRITFVVKEDDALTEVAANARILHVRMLADGGGRLVVAPPRRLVLHAMRHAERLSGGEISAAARIVPVPHMPRTMSGVMEALRTPDLLRNEPPPVAHEISASSLVFRISPATAAGWRRTFDRFLVLFAPHIGERKHPFVFLARKAALSRERGGAGLIRLRLEHAFSRSGNGSVRWVMLPDEGSPELWELVRALQPSARRMA